MRLYEGVKGDRLKANALRLLNAAQRFPNELKLLDASARRDNLRL